MVDDLEIRNSRLVAAGLTLVGAVLGGGALLMLRDGLAREDAWRIAGGAAALLTFGGCGFWGAATWFDRSPKLILSAEGLLSVRTGTFIRWSDVRETTLHSMSTSGAESWAMLIIRFDPGEGLLQLAIPVSGLDRSSKEIQDMIEARSRAAKSRVSP